MPGTQQVLKKRYYYYYNYSYGPSPGDQKDIPRPEVLTPSWPGMQGGPLPGREWGRALALGEESLCVGVTA